MTKIVLCYGVILGLYCLVHGVYSSEDDQTPKPYDAKHRQRGNGYSESGIPKDKIFIKSETPLRGRKIHQSAWSEEEATENSPEELKTEDSSDSRDSWNFEKLYSYLLSLIYKTEEMEQAKMTSTETVEMMRNKIKSEIKARSKPDRGKKGTEASKSPESRRLIYKTDFETSYLDRRFENSESSESEESDEYEPCEEDEDSSSEMYDKGNTKHKENGSEVEDCYEDEESEEKSSPKKETGSIDVKNEETAKERKHSSTSKHTNNQLSGQEVTITSVKDNRKPFNILRKTTGAARTESTPKFPEATSKSMNTAKTNKDGNAANTGMGITPTTSSYVHESTTVNLPTNSGFEKSTDQFIQSRPDIQDKVNFNTVTKSNAKVTPTKSSSTSNGNSAALQTEILNPGTPTTLNGLLTQTKTATEILPQDNFEVILTAPEFIPIDNKVIGDTEMSPSKINEVKPNIDEMLNMPVEVAHVYGGKQSEAQRLDKSETEVSLQNQVAKETKSETSLGDSMIFTQGNMENNQFQQETFNHGRKDDILEEYNLKNEFIDLSDNNKMEFMNMLNDYNMNSFKYDDGSQHSSISKNVEFDEENTNQETFDTILEFLYKHSKNPLILSLRNSNKTLF